MHKFRLTKGIALSFLFLTCETSIVPGAVVGLGEEWGVISFEFLIIFFILDPPEIFGPNPQEIMQQLEACELSNSCANTPNMSPATSLLATNTLYSSGVGSKHGSMERGRVRSLSTQSASGSTRKDSHV